METCRHARLLAERVHCGSWRRLDVRRNTKSLTYSYPIGGQEAYGKRGLSLRVRSLRDSGY